MELPLKIRHPFVVITMLAKRLLVCKVLLVILFLSVRWRGKLKQALRSFLSCLLVKLLLVVRRLDWLKASQRHNFQLRCSNFIYLLN